MEKIQIRSNSKNVKASITLSGSKSISNRLLIINALAEGKSTIRNISNADDTTLLRKLLTMIKTCASSRIPMVVDAGNAGTVFRFLTAFLANQEGKWLLTGSDRMKQRPVGELVSALTKLGADVKYGDKHGFPPLSINGENLNSRELVIKATESSQFVSALMMVAPCINDGLIINFSERPVSFPYIQMTAKLMKDCGAGVILSEERVQVSSAAYNLADYFVEPDWSSASYWYEMAALSNSSDISLSGFKKESLQGDSIVADIFKALGVHTEFEDSGIRLSNKGKSVKNFKYDFNDCPDLVPAVVVTCAGKGIHAELTGIEHLRFKESDRIEALKKELSKIGAEIKVIGKRLMLIPSDKPPKQEFVFESHDDHRIAMSLAPLALKFEKVTVNNPEVVNKSYSSFWKDIQQNGMFSVNKY